MVFGSHVALGSLSVLSSSFVDIFSSVISTNEGHSLDIRVNADALGGVEATLDDIENSLGESDLLSQLADLIDGSSHSLGWLQDEGITTGDGKGEHPEGNHHGEVEGGHSSTDSQWGLE